MSINRTFIDIHTPVAEWYETLIKSLPNNDFVVLCDNRNDLIWFMTNLTQYLSRQGGNEVAVVYGRQTVDLMSFIYQLNFSLPVGYQIGEKNASHALYDLLLNFETEPPARFIIWNDADHLYNYDRDNFELVFDNMIVAAYCNRHGVSTLKEDGTPYRVDQRNIFVFNQNTLGDLEQLLTNEYYIPSIIKSENKCIDFNVVELLNLAVDPDSALAELNDYHEEECDLMRLLEESDYSLDSKELQKIHHRYQEIHTAYITHESLEALKRAVFLQWYAAIEPSYLSGIDLLDHNDEIRTIKRLDDLIRSNTLDAELTMMLDYYYRMADWYFDGFEHMEELKDFFRRDQPTSLVKIESGNRGQMGEYWSSLNL